MTEPCPDYLDRLRLAYEEEIETEAYFAALAERMEDRPRRENLHLLAELERVTARLIAPLLDRHGLQPLDDASLAERGRAQAVRQTPDWDRLMAEMRRTYPGYIAYFETLEADGPPADRARLAFLPEHERAALNFLRLEAAGDPDCGATLRRYLDAPAQEAPVVDGA